MKPIEPRSSFHFSTGLVPGSGRPNPLPDDGEPAVVAGAVQRVRHMGAVRFILVRRERDLVQCVAETCRVAAPGQDAPREDLAWLSSLSEGDIVVLEGALCPESRAPGGRELRIRSGRLLSRPAGPLPLSLARPVLSASLETLLDHRPLTLRHPRERAVFRIQDALCRGFRDDLAGDGFTEIHSPKIVGAGVEGGAGVFRLDYFGREACLAQSPQMYKQAMVGVFGRVFEVGPVYRAERHNTTRHLNEYMGLDFEMGFISGHEEIMARQAGVLAAMMASVRARCAAEIDLLEVEVPVPGTIPSIRFDEAREILGRLTGTRSRGADLSPEEEAALGRHAREAWNSEFLFVTHYPSSKRPFYAMDDPEDPRFTLSFDLLFRGMEITTGGQRIHDHETQVRKMKARGLHPEDFVDYLQMHAAGMPPHGGLGMGLERATMQLCRLGNIRRASLFPRDTGRASP